MKTLLMTTTLALALIATTSAQAGADECFARVYNATHLARHPDQLVTSVSLRFRPAPAETRSSPRERWFVARFTLRGKGPPLDTAGVCNGGHCYVEDDGGGLDHERTADGLIVRLDRIRVAERAMQEIG